MQVLIIDNDWMPKRWWPEWERTRRLILTDMGFQVLDVLKHPSYSKKGLHIWIHIEGKKLSDMDKVKLQYLLGDDPVRSKINHRRVWRGIRGFWNKIFSVKHRLKDLPKRCEKCRLRRYIHELEGKDESWLENKQSTK